MKYIIEIDKEIFDYMARTAGDVEKYFKNKVIAPILVELKNEKMKEIYEREETSFDKKLKELQKKASIKLDVEEKETTTPKENKVK